MAPTAGTRLRMQKAHTKKQHKHQKQPTKKIPSLKNRIRGLERFLKRGGLEEATRAAKQRELKELQREHEAKEDVETQKKNAEKYKKPRFFERVKLMRKLKQAENKLKNAESKAEKTACKEAVKICRQHLMYLFFFPKTEPYISLYPSTPHEEPQQARQTELLAAAIARFKEEQPADAFHQFCYNDKEQSDGAEPSTSSSSAAALLLKRPSKEDQKKNKKARTKKSTDKQRTVVADMEDGDLEKNTAAAADQDNEGAEEEEDDFFL